MRNNHDEKDTNRMTEPILRVLSILYLTRAPAVKFALRLFIGSTESEKVLFGAFNVQS